MPQIPNLLKHLNSFTQILIFNKQKTNLSNPIADPPPLKQQINNIQTIINTTKIKQTTLYKISKKNPTNVLFTTTYPNHTSTLILYKSTPHFHTNSNIS